MLAWLTDLVMVGVSALLFTSLIQVPKLILLVMGESRPPTIPIEQFAFFAIALFIAYHASCLWLTRRSAGKAIAGLRVRRRSHGTELGWALGRPTLGYLVVDLLGLGVLPALLDGRHRCLHDRVFGTEVILEHGEPSGRRWPGPG